MATSLPWSVKGVDPRTRDAAKAAARRAGMTLGEWLDNKIREEAGEPETVAQDAEEQDIAALSERLARLSQGGMQTAAAPQAAPARPEFTRDRMDAFITQAAMAERLTRDSNARTASALDSIAQWMERTEGRLSHGERATVERQERATAVIADAIKTMGTRLSDIERRAEDVSRRPAVPPPPPPQATRPVVLSRDGLAAAVSDIRSRQRALDGDARAAAFERPAAAAFERPATAAPTLASLREDLRQLNDRIAPAQPAMRVEEQRAAYKPLERAISELGARLDRLDGRERLDPVLKPLARIEAEISRLSDGRSQESYNRFELEVAHLAAKVDALAARGGDRQMIAPILNELAELREIVSTPDGRRFDDLSLQLNALTSDVGRLRDDTRDLRSLSLAIEDVRESLHTDRLRERTGDSAPLLALSRQVESLAQKLDSLPTMKTSVIDGQVDQLVARLGELDAIGRPASNELAGRIESLVIKLEDLADRPPSRLEDRIETLTDRVEQLAASSRLAQMVDDGGAPLARVDMRPVEDMLRGLAAKIDEAGRPGAGSDSFDALERQIAGLTQRLDQQAATRSAENGIERTLQDLVVHLQGMREDTTAAAERAARAAMADLPPSRGASLSELSDLMSGLRETHVSTGRETQDAIGAVHRTLETIIGRLGDLEAELGDDRRGGAPTPRVRTPAAADEIRAVAPAIPMAERFAAETRLPRTGGLDLPLEPGSGRPRPEAPAPQGNDPQAVRQSLIAAARRSAKAASDAAATNPAATETTKPGKAAKSASGSGRLKEILEKRRRPLLLGLAALVLAIGAAQVFSSSQQGSAKKQVVNESSSRTETTRPAPAEAPAAKPAPQGAPTEPAAPPVKDQSSALPPLQIGTTPAQAAVPAPAQTASAESPPPAASVPSMVASLPLQSPSEAVETVTGIGELPPTAGTTGLRKAALAGDARAVYQIAAQAADGPGNRDPKLALRLFERAAVAGLGPAQFRLGNMFEKGIGTNRDPALAKVWYGRAAERGNAKAMHNLAVLYAEGAGGKPDYATATDWFRRAAEHGVRDSQYNLAILLGRGLGAPADLSQSYRWFAIAAAQGDEDAGRKRDEVASRLPAGDLAAAKAAAESWKPKPLEANANEVTQPPKGWDEPPVAAKKPAKPSRG
ncbi:Localization factor PodJL [Bosea sp. 62]|uniref:tetratricopeptide repeat protein n=1 Tax=unclassified Bosea (in: a-proteobacteria) TaxID=2653178 RepID=UPI0012596E1E|nr:MULTISPECIES: tetratricopeptide repeat protein [unclassified Bosea (in: a-proteobacteria)]CAD5294579.1 Localization factor PodJL [Bosea sp. 7B]CAD5297795.1 Localization factor PodJL [Bosea sp. 21B]CAD5298006.1 Localization factor PodJL [Bosea sp. 46]VVT61348.1 Localization factor PodJL [Bosea sp. EC-HK365B]VXB18912.1 Localization factor PodJL [Bosea sp. 127]